MIEILERRKWRRDDFDDILIHLHPEQMSHDLFVHREKKTSEKVIDIFIPCTISLGTFFLLMAFLNCL